MYVTVGTTAGTKRRINFALRSKPVLIQDDQRVIASIVRATPERFELFIDEDLELDDEVHVGFYLAAPVTGRVVMRAEVVEAEASGERTRVILNPLRIVTQDGAAAIGAFLVAYLGVPGVERQKLQATTRGGIMFPMSAVQKASRREMPKRVRVNQDVAFFFGPIAANGHQCMARLYEITESGISMITNVNPAQGDFARVMVPVPEDLGGGTTVMMGTVKWVMPSHSGNGFGVELDTKNQAQMKALKNMALHYSAQQAKRD